MLSDETSWLPSGKGLKRGATPDHRGEIFVGRDVSIESCGFRLSAHIDDFAYYCPTLTGMASVLTTNDRLIEQIEDKSYLAFLRPTPRPFMRFVSGHFPPNVVTQPHSHPCIALHGCLQGPLTLVTPEGDAPLDAGVFYLFAANVRHYWRNPGRSTGATIGLLIDTERPGRWPAATGVVECCRRLDKLVTGVHRFSTARDDEMRHAFWLAADQLTSLEPRDPMVITGALLTLMGQCASRMVGEVEQSTPTYDLAQQIRRLLLARVNDRLGINDVARELRISPTRAKEAFREAFGSGIIAYHNQLKIWQAKRLLCDPSYTVTQVSRKLGFSSHSYFSRVFLQHTGESPTVFRHRNAGEGD